MTKKISPKWVPPVHSQFKPGQSGNPGGKAIGTRNRLQGAFLRDLADDYDEHGRKAIAAMREADPGSYVRAILSLMPKELEIKRPLEDMTDDDIAAAIALLRSAIAAQGPGAGDGDAEESSQTH